MALGNKWDSKVRREPAVPRVHCFAAVQHWTLSLQFSACQLHFHLFFTAVFTEQECSPHFTFHSFSNLERDELKALSHPNPGKAILALLSQVHTPGSVKTAPWVAHTLP